MNVTQLKKVKTGEAIKVERAD